MPGQQQQCTSDMECTGGKTCQSLFGGMGGFFGGGGMGGFFGGGGMSDGGDGGGGAGGVGGLPFMLPMVCRAPASMSDGGVAPDSGSSTDAGTANTTDAAPPSEAGSSSDASGD
jgi:hypothetical protein